jgi:hypothetical protein
LHRNQIFAWRRQFRSRAALIDNAVAEFVPVTLASPTGSGPAMGGETSRIEVVAAGITIRLGTGLAGTNERSIFVA